MDAQSNVQDSQPGVKLMISVISSAGLSARGARRSPSGELRCSWLALFVLAWLAFGVHYFGGCCGTLSSHFNTSGVRLQWYLCCCDFFSRLLERM